jgi:predicted transcriptional regulator
MAKDLTAIRIDGELIDGLKAIIANAPMDSVYRDRSVNWLIGRAVEEFIERNKAKTSNKKGTP